MGGSSISAQDLGYMVYVPPRCSRLIWGRRNWVEKGVVCAQAAALEEDEQGLGSSNKAAPLRTCCTLYFSLLAPRLQDP